MPPTSSLDIGTSDRSATWHRIAEPGYSPPALVQVFDAVAEQVDRRIGWHRLPLPLGLVTLIGLRNILRSRNLHDTTAEPAVDLPEIEPASARHRVARTADGSWNDLGAPRMGMAGSRFGRNVPLDETFPGPPSAVLDPDPRTVSRRLMTRDRLIAAETANVFLASWIQFMVRDWFSHGSGRIEDAWEIPIGADDDFPERPLRIPRIPPDPTRPPGASPLPPTFVNYMSHWWDGSQIYGNSAAEQARIRTGADGHVRTERPPSAADGSDPTQEPGFWVGLAMMQHLFVLEHNAICDRLHAEYPDWQDEELFQRARLVNTALMAKIHTVEWTPAVIAHPTTQAAMRANWYGLAGERLRRALGRISSGTLISGIPGSATDHFGVPYALTEEFTAVYRMHPLMPDEFVLRSLQDDTVLQEATLRELAGPGALQVMDKHDLADLLYSFGTAHPGLVTLRNYPRYLQEFERPDGHVLDLAATDVLRCRELGVPRYNQFRRLLHRPPVRDFAALTDDAELAEEISALYDGDIEKVDLVVGLFAEQRPQGFAFSDTAFRIFILMASRRLNSDRFLSADFTPQIYTQVGIDWVQGNGFGDVLVRHFPQLRPALAGVANPFAPWHRAGATT